MILRSGYYREVIGIVSRDYVTRYCFNEENEIYETIRRIG